MRKILKMPTFWFTFIVLLSGCRDNSIETKNSSKISETQCYLAVGEDHYTGVILHTLEDGTLTGSLADYLQNYQAGRNDITERLLTANGFMGEQTITLNSAGIKEEQVWTITLQDITFIRMGWASGYAKVHDCENLKVLLENLKNEKFEPSQHTVEVPG